jgi:hypothetical protein
VTPFSTCQENRRQPLVPPLSFHIHKRFATLALAVCLPVGLAVASEPAKTEDRLASEIERWSKYLQETTSTEEFWIQIKDVSVPVMQKTEAAMRDGRRLLALQRLAAARGYLAAWSYLSERSPETLKDQTALEAEWARLGKTLRDTRQAPSVLDGVRPAALRAMGETAIPQTRAYYDASLEYGRNTMPFFGFYYLAEAQAQKDFVDLCRSLSVATPLRPPPLRSLHAEIEALEGEFLAVYRPPVSIDRHGEFIAAHSALKEARELDDAGLRYGALLRYLEAARRFGPLRQPAPQAHDTQTLQKRLADFESRLGGDRLDHSIGRLFLEAAQADLSARAPDTGPVSAVAIATDVLPRYFAALKPAARARKPPAPKVTVTMVRWPYT